MAYIRKTHDEYHTQGYYSPYIGWETVTIDYNWKGAKQSLKDYRDNEPQYPHRIIKKRVKNN